MAEIDVPWPVRDDPAAKSAGMTAEELAAARDAVDGETYVVGGPKNPNNGTGAIRFADIGDVSIGDTLKLNDEHLEAVKRVGLTVRKASEAQAEAAVAGVAEQKADDKTTDKKTTGDGAKTP